MLGQFLMVFLSMKVTIASNSFLNSVHISKGAVSANVLAATHEMKSTGTSSLFSLLLTPRCRWQHVNRVCIHHIAQLFTQARQKGGEGQPWETLFFRKNCRTIPLSEGSFSEDRTVPPTVWMCVVYRQKYGILIFTAYISPNTPKADIEHFVCTHFAWVKCDQHTPGIAVGELKVDVLKTRQVVYPVDVGRA